LSEKYKEVVIYLLRHKDLYKDELKKETEELFVELKALIVLRNTVMHSFWTMDENGQISRAKYKRHLKNDLNILEEKEVTLSSINNLPNDIIKFIKKFNAFKKKILSLVAE
jgi:uncharacterized protein YutE (UPF0331/DUF86 family)